jgi:DNA polymerase-3 subunit beta
LLQVTGNTLELAAADGYRLAVRQCVIDAPDAPSRIIVPRTALIELGRLCGAATGQIGLSVAPAQNRLEAQGEGWTLSTRLIEGEFPDYPRIIPRQPTTRVTVNRGELLQALRFSGTLAAFEGGIVRFVVTRNEVDASDPPTLLVSVVVQEHGDHAVTMPVALDGAPGRIALNARYVREALESFGTGQVAFGWASESSPALLAPVGGEGPTAVVMAMACQDWPAAAEREAAAV